MAPFLGPDGQGNRDFSRYYADFVRLVTVLQCDEGTQQRALERGLSAELQSSLRYQDVPASETLTAYADRIKRLDGSIRRDKVFSAPPCAAAVPTTRPPPTTGNIAWPQTAAFPRRARPPSMHGRSNRAGKPGEPESERVQVVSGSEGRRPPAVLCQPFQFKLASTKNPQTRTHSQKATNTNPPATQTDKQQWQSHSLLILKKPSRANRHVKCYAQPKARQLRAAEGTSIWEAMPPKDIVLQVSPTQRPRTA